MRENKANRDIVNHVENTSFIVLAFWVFFLQKVLTVIERTENEKKEVKASKENEKERKYMPTSLRAPEAYRK